MATTGDATTATTATPLARAEEIGTSTEPTITPDEVADLVNDEGGGRVDPETAKGLLLPLLQLCKPLKPPEVSASNASTKLGAVGRGPAAPPMDAVAFQLIDALSGWLRHRDHGDIRRGLLALLLHLA